jgi:hypothetical protein
VYGERIEAILKEVMEVATAEVTNNGRSVRSVAKGYGICRASLHRFCVKLRKNENSKTFYKPLNWAFHSKQEEVIRYYVKRAADPYYGLSTRDLRRLAYQCAVHNKLKFPRKWCESETAGTYWLNAFLKINPSLSIRRPKATSLARATNLNRANVDIFFDNISNVLHQNEPHNVYNADETVVHIIQAPNKINAAKEKEPVRSITSSERGMIVCVAVNATGNCVPPMFVFPRKNFHDHFLRGGPVRCIGAGNGSGWMQREEFLACIKHFAKHAKPTKDTKVLLLLDNHESHPH